MNSNKRTRNSANMDCDSALHTSDNDTNEAKALFQRALHNVQADMECAKKCMEFAKIMLSYSCDKMKRLESQIRQMKSAIDGDTPIKQSSSDDEQAVEDEVSVLSEGTATEATSDNIDCNDKIVEINSYVKEPRANRRKKLRESSQNMDRSTQTSGSNMAEDSSKTDANKRQASEEGPFNVCEATTRKKTSQHTTSSDIIISDDFIAIDSSEKKTYGSKKKRLGLNTGNQRNFARSQETCDKHYQYSSETEVVDLDGEPTTSNAVNSTGGEVEETDTEAVRMAVQKTKGILPSQNLLTFLYLSRQVDNPVQLANAFTTDIKTLYLQLVTFQFHLQDINETLEQQNGDSPVDRRLENRLQMLIEVFQAECQSKSD